MTDPASRPPPEPASAAALRAQLLATEHWSLLATRSTTQSELLSRITMFLTLVSATLVSLALIGQATAFDAPFTAIALTLGSFVVVIGTLTLVRVNNGSNEDRAHVIGMNRLRAAYVELDPELDRFLVASSHDDDQGISQTYNPLEGPKRSQVIGSSFTFILFVTAGLMGALGAIVAQAAQAGGAVIGVVAAICFLGYIATALSIAGTAVVKALRRYAPRFPTPAGSDRPDEDAD